MSVRVVRVNLGSKNFTNYIGRTWAGHAQSVFHNPHHLGPGVTRQDAIAQFAAYWYAPEQRLLRTRALQMIADDGILGCWCKPLDCHGDIIAGYLNWKRQEAQLW